SSELRRALVEGRETRAIAERLPELRRAVDLDRRFDGVLRAWLAPTSPGLPMEIAASPFEEGGRNAGRAYGDRGGADAPPIALFVRRASDRRLLAPREALARKDFAPRDRRVLDHARERGAGRKAVYAEGALASLTLEAMRAHGGIFAAGFKTLLDFRS